MLLHACASATLSGPLLNLQPGISSTQERCVLLEFNKTVSARMFGKQQRFAPVGLCRPSVARVKGYRPVGTRVRDAGRLHALMPDLDRLHSLHSTSLDLLPLLDSSHTKGHNQAWRAVCQVALLNCQASSYQRSTFLMLVHLHAESPGTEIELGHVSEASMPKYGGMKSMISLWHLRYIHSEMDLSAI